MHDRKNLAQVLPAFSVIQYSSDHADKFAPLYYFPKEIYVTYVMALRIHNNFLRFILRDIRKKKLFCFRTPSFLTRERHDRK